MVLVLYVEDAKECQTEPLQQFAKIVLQGHVKLQVGYILLEECECYYEIENPTQLIRLVLKIKVIFS
mgnify:CR=1 FL=1